MVLNGFLASFVAAVQASLSALLIILYGTTAARSRLLNASSSKAISKICVKMFEHAPDSDDDQTIDGGEEKEPRTPSRQFDELQLEHGETVDNASEQARLLSPGPQSRNLQKCVTNITFSQVTTLKRRPRYMPQLHRSNLSARTS